MIDPSILSYVFAKSPLVSLHTQLAPVENQRRAPVLKVRLILHDQAYTVRLIVRGHARLSVWRGPQRVYSYSGKLLNPWRLEVGDLDADGSPEILVGVKKTTWNLPFLHTTIFVLGFNGHQVYRKWTGSTLGRPLLDFCVGDGKLYTLERSVDGQLELSSNLWTGFGFRKQTVWGHWRMAEALKFKDHRLYFRGNGVSVTVDPRGAGPQSLN